MWTQLDGFAHMLNTSIDLHGSIHKNEFKNKQGDRYVDLSIQKNNSFDINYSVLALSFNNRRIIDSCL